MDLYEVATRANNTCIQHNSLMLKQNDRIDASRWQQRQNKHQKLCCTIYYSQAANAAITLLCTSSGSLTNFIRALQFYPSPSAEANLINIWMYELFSYFYSTPYMLPTTDTNSPGPHQNSYSDDSIFKHHNQVLSMFSNFHLK